MTKFDRGSFWPRTGSGLIAAALLIAAGSAALADEAKKIDFTTNIVVDGVTMINDFKCPLKDNPASTKDKPLPLVRDCETPMTVGELAFFALQRAQPGQSWADGVKRNDLAHLVRTSADFPLSGDQLAMIENALGPTGVSNGVLGAVAAVIDPKAK